MNLWREKAPHALIHTIAAHAQSRNRQCRGCPSELQWLRNIEDGRTAPRGRQMDRGCTRDGLRFNDNRLGGGTLERKMRGLVVTGKRFGGGLWGMGARGKKRDQVPL